MVKRYKRAIVCYLGSIIHKDREVEEEVNQRVSGWSGEDIDSVVQL